MQKPFGRRVNFYPKYPPPMVEPRVPPPSAAASAPVGRDAIAASRFLATSDDDELRAWRRARLRKYTLPWRPILLMASLCFGIGALVLPDTISDDLDWLLYGMMALSFIAGLRQRSQET